MYQLESSRYRVPVVLQSHIHIIIDQLNPNWSFHFALLVPDILIPERLTLCKPLWISSEVWPVKAAAVSAFRSGLPGPCQWFPWPSSGMALKHLSDPAILSIPRSTANVGLGWWFFVGWICQKYTGPSSQQKSPNPSAESMLEKEKGSLPKESLHSPSPQQCVQWCQRHPPAVYLLLMLDPTAVKRFSISNISVDVSLHLYCNPFHGHGQYFLSRFKIQSPLLNSAASCHFRHRWSCALFLFGHRSPSVATKTAKGHPHLADQPTFSAKASPKTDPA